MGTKASKVTECDGNSPVGSGSAMTLRDMLKMLEEDVKPETYKLCIRNLRSLIQVQERAMNMEKKGQKYADGIRDWIASAERVTKTIPSYTFSDKMEQPRNENVIKYYNEIMKRGAKDFELFAGSLTPIVVSKEIIDEAINRADAQIRDLESEQKDEPSGESNLLSAAVVLTHSMPRLMSLAQKFMNNTDGTKAIIENLEKRATSICVSRISDKNMANLVANLDSYYEDFILFRNENESTGKRAARIFQIVQSGPEAKEIVKARRCLLDLLAAKLLKIGYLNSKLTEFTSKISLAADRLTDVLSEEASSIISKLTEPTVRWRNEFNRISRQQIHELHYNVNVNRELKKNNMNILYVSWSDVGRAQGSCGGPNITDVQFFAIPPLKLRPAAPRYHDLDRGLFCIFPAVRSPNFTDEVDIRTASTYTFKVRDLQGEVKVVTMAFFLKNIGRYITDLDPNANWEDEVDRKKDKMQVASQFSVLPLLECTNHRVELGISAFGYQKKNLHIIVGPNGDLGWAPEGLGYKRIFFRDTAGIMDAVVSACEPYFEGSIYICNIISRFVLGFGQELRAVALVPEDRQEVSRSFFKEPVKDESIEEEAQRYVKVENKLIHIQIEMVRGEEKGDFSAQEMFTCDGLSRVASDLKSKKNILNCVTKIRENIAKDLENEISCNQLDYNSVTHKKLPSRYEQPIDIGKTCWGKICRYLESFFEFKTSIKYVRLNDSEDDDESDAADTPDRGLLLARVQMGDSVGRADHTDCIPFGSKRSEGMAVRVTEMFYSMAKNAEFTQPRIYRFMQQMSFARRDGNLAHGSLVTGQGTWGEELPPITLSKGYQLHPQTLP